ncbi:(2Fe-2S)-binding protein [Bosea sp. CS1GBMeth4]|uniref:(2Fe-2S)-binding protein n=1 Tax=Bosea sp. CS1GBMeth4 TaxID=1892849 RepID=UPI0016463E58|nr:(2Fe-2S)-binding protein [Bosea sp. CS1GBMeth4]
MALFRRVAARAGRPVTLSFEGRAIRATSGDSVLAALLENGALIRRLEFGREPRAGFCLMGACQDCWVWSAEGGRIRACTTEVGDGMILSAEPQLPAGSDG